MEIKLKEKYLSLNKEVAYLVFNKPEGLAFKAGQFMMIDNGEVKRAYSIASSPLDKDLSFYVKKASENGMSKYLVEDIKEGNSLEALGPFGHMILEEDKNTNYLLISTGSGLAPILSIYRTLIKTGKFNKIVNLYGERYYSSIVENILNEMKSYETDKVKNYFYLSREEKEGFYKGYVQKSLEDAISFLGKENLKVYVCGKPTMVDETISRLEKLGIGKEHIKFEKF